MMEIGFLLKKFISFFLEPVGLILTLLFFGIYFFYRKNESRARELFFASFLLLFLFAYPPFANYLVEGLEDQYSKYEYKQPVEYIHILGNSHDTDNSQPISSQISDAGVKRVVEGVVIYKKVPDSKLIFTGFRGETDTSNALMNAKLAEALGVSRKDMLINPLPRDTKEEALFTKTVVGAKPFVLVTSASHMPRAMLLFKSLGMHPIAAPTNFYKEEFRGYLRAPNIHAFYISTLAIHEYLGIVWAKLKALL
jgi:uncharacterized SAM-binding protein YcdF (DUF218 family)